MSQPNIVVDSNPQGISFSLLTTGLLQLPRQADWIERGIVISSGPDGSWDNWVGPGMLSPFGVVKKAGKYFLYYGGGDIMHPTILEAEHRALGVATSSDGIHFTKYSGNPIITYAPYGRIWEGIFSAGVTLDLNGDVVIFAGAMIAPSPTSDYVNGDIRLYVSNDGYHFNDLGIVVSHANSSVWGYGDELFPVGAFLHGGRWHIYYNAKDGSRGIMWDIGLAWGPAKNNLPNTQEVLSMTTKIISCCPIKLSADTIALFFGIEGGTLDIRTAPITSPATPTPTLSYYLDNSNETSLLFYDSDLQTWFLYYLSYSANAILLRTAPARFA